MELIASLSSELLVFSMQYVSTYIYPMPLPRASRQALTILRYPNVPAIAVEKGESLVPMAIMSWKEISSAPYVCDRTA